MSTTLGTQTVVVKVPAGALSGPGTVTVTVYANSAAPHTIQSAGRQVRTVGSSAVLLVEFAVQLTGATLLKPLQASLTTAPAASGSVFRLAGYGKKFDDVDTVTYAGGTATSDLNIAWPRMSLASATAPGTLYAFYTETQADATASVPTPVVTVATTSTLPLAPLSSATFTASEADSNGFPYLDPNFAFSLVTPLIPVPPSDAASSPGSVGSINPSTGVLTTGPLDGSANVQATDTTAGRGNPKGSLAISVTSQRPGNVADSFTFSGTLTSTTQINNSRNHTAPQVDTAAVGLTSTVKSISHQSSGSLSGFIALLHSTETDTYPQLTVTTGTDQGIGYSDPVGGKSTVYNLGTDAKDSNGMEFLTQPDPQNGNGIIDVLPETQGAFGPNTAALKYNEIDQANFTRSRTVNKDGSYVEKGTDALGDVQTITDNPDLSAFYDANQYSGWNFTMSKPTTGTNPTITITLKSGTTPRGSLTIPSWIPPGVTQPSVETDTENTGVTFPAGCSVPAKYGTSGNQIVQTIQRYDAALGNAETLTTTTWVGNGVGPVCIQMSDAVNTYYDYTGQNGNSLILFVSGNGQPIQTTSVTETLTLQSASTQNGTVTLAAKRGTSSVVSYPRTSFGAAVFARARFEHQVRERLGGLRKATVNRNLTNYGVQAL